MNSNKRVKFYFNLPGSAHLRDILCSAIVADCIVVVSGQRKLIDLSQAFSALHAEKVVKHPLLAELPNAEWLKQYEGLVAKLVVAVEIVFNNHPAFSHLPKKDFKVEVVKGDLAVLVSELKQWIQDEKLLVNINEHFVKACGTSLATACASGLQAIKHMLEQGQKGVAGTGMSSETELNLLQKIPLDNPLRPLVAGFLEAGSC